MRTLTKTRTTIATAAALILAMTASMMLFDTAHAASSVRVTQSSGDGSSSVRVTQSSGDGSSSVRVTQSSGDGLHVECEGDVKCEIKGDDTVVATSGDSTTSSTTTNLKQSNTIQSSSTATTNLKQSNTIQSSSDFDAVDEQDLGAMIEGMVDRLLDEIFASAYYHW
jgi:hypothetical protein